MRRKAIAKKREPRNGSLENLRSRAMAILERAEKESDPRTALQAIGVLAKIEEASKLGREISDVTLSSLSDKELENLIAQIRT